MDAFIYKLVIIFIPGIMGRFLLGRLLFIKDNDKFYFILTSFLIGVFSYFIFDLIGLVLKFLLHLVILGSDNSALRDLSSFPTANSIINLTAANPIDFTIIIRVSLISLTLACIWSLLNKNHCLTRILQKIGVTNRTSEPDVWSYLFHHPEFRANSWICVRDRKNDLSYQGYLIAFSDLAVAPELALREVGVYKNSTGEKLYDVNVLYLSVEPERIEIECLSNAQDTKNSSYAIVDNNENEEEGGHNNV